MIKLRIMGTPNDIKWFVKLISRNKRHTGRQDKKDTAGRGFEEQGMIFPKKGLYTCSKSVIMLT